MSPFGRICIVSNKGGHNQKLHPRFNAHHTSECTFKPKGLPILRSVTGMNINNPPFFKLSFNPHTLSLIYRLLRYNGGIIRLRRDSAQVVINSCSKRTSTRYDSTMVWDADQGSSPSRSLRSGVVGWINTLLSLSLLSFLSF